jgi:putative ABC transport system permease protein
MSIAVDLPESVYATAAQLQSFHQRVTGALASLPGVIASGAVNWLPLGGMSTWGDFHLDGGRKLPHGYQMEKPCTSPGYFGALGIRLIAGRDFTDRDNASAPGVVVVSQSVAKTAWGGEDPIGKRLTSEDHPRPEDWLTVVGVVEDVRQSAVTKAAMGAIYQPYLQVARRGWLTHMNFLIRTNSAPEDAARELRSAVRQADPDLPAQTACWHMRWLSAGMRSASGWRWAPRGPMLWEWCCGGQRYSGRPESRWAARRLFCWRGSPPG